MLEIRDLHVKFNNRDREAVGGISLTIHDGEIVGLGRIGKNRHRHEHSRASPPQTVHLFR